MDFDANEISSPTPTQLLVSTNGMHGLLVGPRIPLQGIPHNALEWHSIGLIMEGKWRRGPVLLERPESCSSWLWALPWHWFMGPTAAGPAFWHTGEAWPTGYLPICLSFQNNNIQEIHADTFCKMKDYSYIRTSLEDIRLDGNPINLSKTPYAYMCLPRLPVGSLVWAWTILERSCAIISFARENCLRASLM